ncbi:OsmC family protein [Dasania marina]|uniref:OsmC family protein n=1 Tax=Dasania marina TaxID=471499 RepID=UPI0030D787BF|tara:strand:+ start:22478 stop:22876 length:399 start_codon:yes stop_codon:yes gene_type:complete
MSIDVSWQKDCQFTVTTEKGFTLAVDADAETAPCPTELLLSALGSCSATDVVMGLQEQGVEVQALTNTVTYTLTEQEPCLYKTANLHFTVTANNVSEAQLKTAAENAITKYCHVCLMLKPAIDVSYSIEIKR